MAYRHGEVYGSTLQHTMGGEVPGHKVLSSDGKPCLYLYETHCELVMTYDRSKWVAAIGS